MEEVVEVPPQKQTTRVDSIEQWTEAKDVTAAIDLSSVKGKMRFNIRALSYEDDRRIEAMFPEPKPPVVKRAGIRVPNHEDPKYLDDRAARRFKIYVATIDACWMSLPGKTIEEKIDWAQEHLWRGGELSALYAAILELSGFGRGSHSQSDSPIEVCSPEDWIKSGKTASVWKVQRPKVDLAFELYGLSGAKYKAIAASTEPGPPPMRIPPDVNGQRTGEPVPDENDAGYKRKVDEMREARNLLVLEAGLAHSIPGNTIKDKLGWIGRRPVGEVKSILTAMSDVLGYRSSADFTQGL